MTVVSEKTLGETGKKMVAGVQEQKGVRMKVNPFAWDVRMDDFAVVWVAV